MTIDQALEEIAELRRSLDLSVAEERRLRAEHQKEFARVSTICSGVGEIMCRFVRRQDVAIGVRAEVSAEMHKVVPISGMVLDFTTPPMSEAEVPPFTCRVRAAGLTDPPQDCDWPACGCDPYADKVIEALEESGALKDSGYEHVAGSGKGGLYVPSRWDLLDARLDELKERLDACEAHWSMKVK